MTCCACCGTTQGPFVRDADFPRTPICGYPPRYKGKVTPEDRQLLVRECLSRRAGVESQA